MRGELIAQAVCSERRSVHIQGEKGARMCCTAVCHESCLGRGGASHSRERRMAVLHVGVLS